MSENDFSKLVCKFLEKYLNIPEDFYIGNGILHYSCIPICFKYLIDKKVFLSVEKIKKKALTDYSIILPDKYFKKL